MDYQDLHSSQFLNHFYGLFLSMMILFMIMQKIFVFFKNQKCFNIMMHQRYQGYIQRKHLSTIKLEISPAKTQVQKIYCFYKVLNNNSPNYLFNTIPTSNSSHRRRKSQIILQNRVNHNFFKNSFFLSAIKEENEHDYDTR